MNKFVLGISAVAAALTLALGTVVVAGDKAAKADGAAAAKVGHAAPAFSLQDQDGNTVSLADYKDKVVVLEWFNEGCPYVVKFYREGHMNKWAQHYGDQGVVWLAVNSTSGKTNSDNADIAQKWNITRPILNDADGTVGKAYGARTTPHMYVIGKDGTLLYAGAIDDKPSTNTSDIAGAKNFVAAALDQVLAGETVSTSETKPYGCSVKYAK